MSQAFIACLTCRTRGRRCRGCCLSCYWRHSKAVRLGRANWPDLEGQGLAAPAEGTKWMAGFGRWLRAGK
jgi:hypothetical protein